MIVGFTGALNALGEGGAPNASALSQNIEFILLYSSIASVVTFVAFVILAIVVFAAKYRKNWLWWVLLIGSILDFSIFSIPIIIYLIVRRQDFKNQTTAHLDLVDQLGADEPR